MGCPKVRVCRLHRGDMGGGGQWEGQQPGPTRSDCYKNDPRLGIFLCLETRFLRTKEKVQKVPDWLLSYILLTNLFSLTLLETKFKLMFHSLVSGIKRVLTTSLKVQLCFFSFFLLAESSAEVLMYSDK